MDARASKFLTEAFRIAAVAIPLALYVERRFSSIEINLKMEARHAEELQRAVDRLDSGAQSRVAVDLNGGFANEAIRAAFNNSFRAEVESRQLISRAELDRLLDSIERKIMAEVSKQPVKER